MKDFFKSFGFKVLAAIALLLVGVMIYAASTGGMATIPSMISGAILTPLQSAASAVSGGLNSFAGMFGSSAELQRQIDELQAQLNDYRSKQVELDSLREQNEWLKEYLNIIEQDNDYQFADARVIAIDPADKYNNFTISAGTLSGVSVNDPVITPEGLVGVVYETGLNYSKVRSILDPETQVSATVSRTRNNGIPAGTLSLAQEGQAEAGFPVSGRRRPGGRYDHHLRYGRHLPRRPAHRRNRGGTAGIGRHDPVRGGSALCRFVPAVPSTGHHGIQRTGGSGGIGPCNFSERRKHHGGAPKNTKRRSRP